MSFRKMRKLATLLVCMLLPPGLKPAALTLLGHRVHRSSRIGLCIVWGTKLLLGKHTRIGALNFIACRRLILRTNAYLGIGNRLAGPMSVHLMEQAAIGNGNIVKRAPHPISIGPAVLRLGTLTKLTSSHFVDCMESVRFGRWSVLAGRSSQIWTHGYVHAPTGPGRVRVQGPVLVGDNVYIGSMSIVLPAISITHATTIGSGAVVSKDITERGMYVSQTLRHVDDSFSHLNAGATEGGAGVDRVYFKHPAALQRVASGDVE